MLRVHDLDATVGNDIARCYSARAFLVYGHYNFVFFVENHCNTLKVQQNLDDVFAYTLDSAVLVYHTVDLNFFYRTTWHRGEQDATQCVAQCVAESAL